MGLPHRCREFWKLRSRMCSPFWWMMLGVMICMMSSEDERRCNVCAMRQTNPSTALDDFKCEVVLSAEKKDRTTNGVRNGLEEFLECLVPIATAIRAMPHLQNGETFSTIYMSPARLWKKQEERVLSKILQITRSDRGDTSSATNENPVYEAFRQMLEWVQANYEKETEKGRRNGAVKDGKIEVQETGLKIEIENAVNKMAERDGEKRLVGIMSREGASPDKCFIDLEITVGVMIPRYVTSKKRYRFNSFPDINDGNPKANKMFRTLSRSASGSGFGVFSINPHAPGSHSTSTPTFASQQPTQPHSYFDNDDLLSSNSHQPTITLAALNEDMMEKYHMAHPQLPFTFKFSTDKNDPILHIYGLQKHLIYFPKLKN